MIGIIDYGLGNIKAFINIYNRLHIPVKSIKTIHDFDDISRLILPGVGAFDFAMEKFNQSGLRDPIENLVFKNNIPIIGICVGMQMLAFSSDEGSLPGLGWIPGTVKKFDETLISYSTHLPHMGWNDIIINNNQTIFNDFEPDPKFYFLHSYYFQTENHNQIVATSHYGIDFTCAVNHKNIVGVQFHPEKSHHFGVKLLENFAKYPC